MNKRAHIDILSLSATPIPRSLNFALSGIKTLSTLKTPPPSKKAIRTVFFRFDEEKIRDAIALEMGR